MAELGNVCGRKHIVVAVTGKQDGFDYSRLLLDVAVTIDSHLVEHD